MKKILFFSLTALLAISCFKEQEYPEAQPKPAQSVYSFKAIFSDGNTIPSGAIASAWKPEGSGKRYEYKSSQGGNVPNFEFSGQGNVPTRVAYAVYPDIEVDSLYRGSFYLNIKQRQNAAASSYDKDASIYVAHISDGISTFVPCTGLLNLTIDQNDIAYCKIASTEGKGVAGAVKVSMFENPIVSAAPNSSGYVELVGNLAKGKEFNVAVATEKYSSFEVTLKNSYDIEVFKKTYSGTFDLTKGGSAKLGNVGNPDVSSIKMTVSSSEYDGWTLESVVGYSASDGKRIMGVDVGQTLKESKPLEIMFFGIEPKDYSSTTLWYVFSMSNADQSVVLPIEMTGINIPKATEVTIDAGVLSESRNAAPWYYPYIDKRLKSGAGYAFGDANTYLIQFKESTYSGATLDPDPSIPSSVTIDYRVRGELFGAPRPEGVTFEWLMGYNNSNPKWGKYTMDRTNIYNCDKYSFNVDMEHYKVTVTNTGAHVGSPILLMKKDGEVLWAWTFWNIAADGTRLKAIDFGNTQIANLDIGAPSTQVSAITTKIKLRSATHYYQWGRPIPIFSGNGSGASFGENDSRNANNPRVPICDSGALSVKDAIQHPGQLIQNAFTAGQQSVALNDWCSGGISNNKNLWGGGEATEEGVKSIYDPCPKGWRVPDVLTYKTVFPEAVVAYDVTKYPQEHTSGYQGVYVAPGALFVCCGYFGTNISGDKFVDCRGTNYAETTTAKESALWWTNTFSTNTRSFVFRADYFYEKYNKASEYTGRMIRVEDSNVGRAMAVRCQIDEDNR